MEMGGALHFSSFRTLTAYNFTPLKGKESQMSSSSYGHLFSSQVFAQEL